MDNVPKSRVLLADDIADLRAYVASLLSPLYAARDLLARVRTQLEMAALRREAAVQEATASELRETLQIKQEQINRLMELERSKRQYELLFGGISDYSIAMLDPRGVVVSWNPGVERLFGYRQADVIGLRFELTYPPETPGSEQARRLLEKAEREGRVGHEGLRVRRDGSTFVAHTVVTALRESSGDLIGFAEVTRDLTERLRSEELAVTAETLRQASMLKSLFLANMSHELRTPLNSIIGFTELILLNPETSLDEQTRDDLEVVLSSAKQLLTLINDVLDISKIESGKVQVHVDRFSPELTVKAMAEMAEVLAASKGIRLVTRIEPGLDLVSSDETKIRQICLNLVSNAIKFTPAGEMEVILAPKGTDWWQIAVRDTGIGIAPENAEIVFEEFRQVDASSTRQAGGTGLGLAISRKLARLLGGDITLDSELGKGSTFTLVLPRTWRGPATAPVAPASRVPDATITFLPEVGAGEPIVLAIDDDPTALRLVEEQVQGTPYRFAGASDGETGLRLARELGPRVILLDIRMPLMDGWRVLKELKGDLSTREIPVIIISVVEDKVLGFALGAAEYLVKPVGREQLISAFDRVCPGCRQQPSAYVLVVEHDPEVRRRHCEDLERLGVPWRVARRGQQALEMVAESLPAVVILDLLMPDMDGFQILAALRADARTRLLPVIVVTNQDLGEEAQLRLASARTIWSKGLTPKQLSAGLKTVLAELDPGRAAPRPDAVQALGGGADD